MDSRGGLGGGGGLSANDGFIGKPIVTWHCYSLFRFIHLTFPTPN